MLTVSKYLTIKTYLELCVFTVPILVFHLPSYENVGLNINIVSVRLNYIIRFTEDIKHHKV